MFPPASAPAPLSLPGSILDAEPAWPELSQDESDASSCIILPACPTLPSLALQGSWPDTPIPMSPLPSAGPSSTLASSSSSPVPSSPSSPPSLSVSSSHQAPSASSLRQNHHQSSHSGEQHMQPPHAASLGFHRHKPQSATLALRSLADSRALAPLFDQPTTPVTPTSIHAALTTMDRLFTTDFGPWLRDPANTPLVASWLGAAARDVYVVGAGMPVPASALAAAMTYIVGPWSPANTDQDLYWARIAHLVAGAACARGASVAETALLVHQLTMGPDAEHYSRLMSLSTSSSLLAPTLTPPSLLASAPPSHSPLHLAADSSRPPSPLVLLLSHLIPLITCPTVRHALVDQVVAGWPFAKSHALVCAVDARVPRGTLDIEWKRARVRMWAATLVARPPLPGSEPLSAVAAAAAASKLRLVRRRGSEDEEAAEMRGAPAKRRRTAAEGVAMS